MMPNTTSKTISIENKTDTITHEALAEELKKVISGDVCFDNGSRGAYATDASNYRQVPLGVVLPKTEKNVIDTVRLCKKYNVPILTRGGGTSLAGQGCNTAVVIDMSKYYNRVLWIDKEKRLVCVQPGIVLDDLRSALEPYDLTFGPDPATHDHCTIGGMLGNNSCGVHSVMASDKGLGARTSDNTAALTILTYSGVRMEVGSVSEDELEMMLKKNDNYSKYYAALKAIADVYGPEIRKKFPQIPRRVSGYNLDELLPEKKFHIARALAGTEGTCVVYLQATLHLIPRAKKRSLVVLGYPDVFAAGAHAPEVMKHHPVGLEGMDNELINFMRQRGLNAKDLPLLPEGKGWLLAEFAAETRQQADEKAIGLMEALGKEKDTPTMNCYNDPKQEEMIWTIRESGLGATAFVPAMNDTWPGWEDAAVPPDKVGDYLKDFKKLLDKYGYHAALYGHFGQGCIHCRIDFDMITQAGLEKYKQFTIEAAKLVTGYGGSISGEHGDGQSRADLLEIMYGRDIIQAFHEFKTLWDPDNKMNPGKIVDAYGQLTNLRLGTGYNPQHEETHFQFPEDENNFSRAVLRCVGVGKCRRSEGGTMCPSYMVTKEEKDSTRGRSRLLFEMLQGDLIKDNWKSEAVKDSLDLCLACKGCKGDCPVNVDMATYKAEFLSHYYKGKLRPRTAYAFGLIFRWARLASVWPSFANFLTQTPGLRSIAKTAAGVAPERTIPQFAKQPFKKWFHKRKSTITGNRKVILWADTFNNYFKPHTLIAGTEVLEAAGYEVIVPKAALCCGRPLYDFGMLTKAKKLLVEILTTLREEIQQGIPIVGLEPSCVAVFRDELCNLFPEDEDAKRLKEQTFTLSEFLVNKATGFKVPQLKRKAIVHGHCHHKAIMKTEADHQLLTQLGLDFKVLDSGCCGMAGYFGYEKGKHYEVSVKSGERVLLPAVRKADNETLIITDGFSCREQIEQQTDRQGLHLAQVLQLALQKESQIAYVENLLVSINE